MRTEWPDGNFQEKCHQRHFKLHSIIAMVVLLLSHHRHLLFSASFSPFRFRLPNKYYTNVVKWGVFTFTLTLFILQVGSLYHYMISLFFALFFLESNKVGDFKHQINTLINGSNYIEWKHLIILKQDMWSSQVNIFTLVNSKCLNHKTLINLCRIVLQRKQEVKHMYAKREKYL